MSRIDELEGRLALVEERLGIDVDAIAADKDASLEAGAAQNDMTDAVLEAPGGQMLEEDAGEEPDVELEDQQ